jgi:short-subunit dehydrogenase/uncharacterized protein YbjT (DUF2867 family)
VNIFITGASGFIGRNFLKQLLLNATSEWRVYVLVRDPLNYQDPRVIELQGELNNISAFRDELLESDYVFHLAANATFGNDIDYEAVNYRPTALLVETLRQSRRLKNFVFTSTIGAVDRSPEDNCKAPITTASIPHPRSRYGESKLKSELLIRDSGLPTTIIRPTWVYGENMRTGSHINLFVSMVYERHPVARLAFPGKVSLIHVNDLAKALVNCIGNQAVIGCTYFAETEALPIGKIFALISEKMNIVHPSQLPVPPLSFVVSKVHARLPLTAANLFIDYLWAADELFRKDFKLESSISIADGIEDVIRTNVKISGKWVITGANSGIGLALAGRLATAGRGLVLIDKCTNNLYQFSDATIICANLANEADIDRISAQLSETRIACLVNNAGIGVRGALSDISTEEIKLAVAVNALAPILLTRKLVNRLVAQESVIVNVASSIAYNPLPFMSLYSSTKALISNWSESLSYELRKTNCVITFSPSGTLTDFQRSAGVKVMNSGKGMLTPEYVADRLIEAVRHKKKLVILGMPTKVMLLVSRILPRRLNITLWGKLFEKYR